MKLRSFGALAVLAGLVLTGCSTSPVTEQQAEVIPGDRIYAPELVGRPGAGDARATFLRDSGIFGSACSHDVYVNNRKAFSIRQGEGISLRLQPGDYTFRLETGAGMCPNVATSQDVTLKPDSAVTYRILLPSDGSLRLTRTR
ncbi:hypothetical protein QN096_11680 [Metapseudomonas otitidis]|uniref:hypothetical protein n=1 Tax=Metapseudomonas otitidis TaxID=319939 RepID=UPI00254249E7|nr:hypothetical protein [Pseudomonas otitidis]WIF69760.1 hypothetical protein QN096_11680 [Pseudomonas otitidis]